VALHPIADELEDAWGDTFFEEGHASTLTNLIAEISADGGAGGGDENQDQPIGGVAGRHEDEHDVGDTGAGEGDEGRVDDGDEEEAEDAEAEEEMEEGGVSRPGSEEREDPRGDGTGHNSGWDSRSHT
jgi:hypothetical protein